MVVFPSTEHVQWPVEVAWDEISGAAFVGKGGRNTMLEATLVYVCSTDGVPAMCRAQ